MKRLPDDCKFYAWIEEDQTVSRTLNGHLEFFYDLEKIIDSYIKIARNCCNCKEYYFCSNENKEDLHERKLENIYLAVCTKYGMFTIANLLVDIFNAKPQIIYENFLLSGLWIYIMANITNSGLPQPNIENHIDMELFYELRRTLENEYKKFTK